MDATDRHILEILQEDATLSIAEIGERVGLSQTPCWKRIQRLELEGVIERRVALLNPEKLGLKITALVAVETNDHSAAWLHKFATTISDMKEVLDIYRMAGDVDYILRIVVPDMQAYDAFYKRLIEAIPLKNVSTRFAMERVKATTALPLSLGMEAEISRRPPAASRIVANGSKQEPQSDKRRKISGTPAG